MEGISIILTAFNSQDFIEETLDSIERQTYFQDNNEYEVLLGIDACENTLQKVNTIRGKYRNLKVYLNERNVGTFVTGNSLIQKAKYDYILPFDTDDVMRPEMVETLMRNLGEMVRFKMQNFGGDSLVLDTWRVALIRKECFLKINGYRDWKCGADSDLVKRFEQCFTVRRIPDVLFDRRVHPASLTNARSTNFNSRYRKRIISFVEDGRNYSTRARCILSKMSVVSQTQV